MRSLPATQLGGISSNIIRPVTRRMARLVWVWMTSCFSLRLWNCKSLDRAPTVEEGSVTEIAPHPAAPRSRRMFGSGDDAILCLLVKAGEVLAVAADADDEVGVAFGMVLGIEKLFLVEDGDL